MIIIIYANKCDRHPGHVTPFEEKLVNAISSDILIIDVTYYTAHQNAAECYTHLIGEENCVRRHQFDKQIRRYS